MSSWILSKILLFLSNREGCESEAVAKGVDESRVIIKDSLGFRYEVSVKLLGRTVLWTDTESVKLTKTDIKQIGEMRGN